MSQEINEIVDNPVESTEDADGMIVDESKKVIKDDKDQEINEG